MTKTEARNALDAAMAAYTGGVTKIASGEVARPDLDAKAWHRRASMTSSDRMSADDNRLISERHVVVGHGGREFVTNGLGERIA